MARLEVCKLTSLLHRGGGPSSESNTYSRMLTTADESVRLPTEGWFLNVPTLFALNDFGADGGAGVKTGVVTVGGEDQCIRGPLASIPGPMCSLITRGVFRNMYGTLQDQTYDRCGPPRRSCSWVYSRSPTFFLYGLGPLIGRTFDAYGTLVCRFAYG